MLNRNDATMYNNIEITANDSQFAQKYTINIEDEFLRKKLFYALSITSSLKNFLNKNGFYFNINDSLFQIPQIIENYEYVDIYSKNLPIQIAYTFENDIAVSIPKVHFDASIEPKMYIVAKLHSSLTTFDLIGTINTNFLNKINENNNYIYVDTTSLNNIDNLENDIDKFIEDYEIIKNCEIFNHVKTNFISLIDKNLTVTEIVDLIKHLSKCPKCRQQLLYYYKFESIIRNSKIENDLIDEIDKFINNPNYVHINDEKVNINEEEDFKSNDVHNKYNYENKVENEINKDVVKTEDDLENNSYENNFEENQEKKQNIDEFLNSNVNEQINQTNYVETTTTEDNSKLNLLYNENQTIKENIDEIENINENNLSKTSIRKIIIFPIISILMLSFLGYLGYTQYFKQQEGYNEINNKYIVQNIPPENAQIDNKNAKTHEVLVPRPLKLSQISWEAPEIVLKTPIYNKYLIDVGKNLKINLQNKFIELKEMVYQTKFQLQILIDTNGSIADIKIIQASGNELIDELIISTTRQTLNYIKPPMVDTIKEPLILILEFEF